MEPKEKVKIKEVEERISKLSENKKYIENNPKKVVKDKIKAIDDKLPNLKDYPVKKKGNINMKTHIENLKKNIKGNPNKFVAKKKDKIEKALKRAEEKKKIG